MQNNNNKNSSLLFSKQKILLSKSMKRLLLFFVETRFLMFDEMLKARNECQARRPSFKLNTEQHITIMQW